MTKTSNSRQRQWSFVDGTEYRICGSTTGRLPPDAYSCSLDGYGNPKFLRRPLLIDELIEYPGSLPSQILDELNRFWTMGEQFHKYGFRHRRGYLFYGKQGTGKSSLIHQIIGRVIAQGNVAIFCDAPETFIECIEEFRLVEPDRSVLCIFEDIDAMVCRHGSSSLLQWLDGNSQIDKAVNIATTNHPERLDRRLKARPRRFDRLIRIDAPDARFRDAYFTQKLPDVAAEDRRRWVDISDGLTFAAMAELVISVCCLEKGLEESAALLKELDSGAPSSNEYEQSTDDHDELEAGGPLLPVRHRDEIGIPF